MPAFRLLAYSRLIGGENSVLASDDVMVVPGHLADTNRPMLLAATKYWSGKELESFAKCMQERAELCRRPPNFDYIALGLLTPIPSSWEVMVNHRRGSCRAARR
jgi:hypothetical protein